jgi:gamma-carbonic anhydrase
MILGRAIREVGQGLDRVGSRMTHDVAYIEKYSRHRQIMPLDELWPSYGKSFIAPNASVIGEVLIGNNCAIWYGSVLKGDLCAIRIDDNVSIGENTVLQTNFLLPQGIPSSVTIANNVLIEHHSSLCSCVVDKGARVGAGSIVQAGAKLETYSVLLPGSVVGPGATVSAFSVFGGNPAKYVRDVTPDDITENKNALKSALEQAWTSNELLKSLGH